MNNLTVLHKEVLKNSINRDINNVVPIFLSGYEFTKAVSSLKNSALYGKWMFSKAPHEVSVVGSVANLNPFLVFALQGKVVAVIDLTSPSDSVNPGFDVLFDEIYLSETNLDSVSVNIIPGALAFVGTVNKNVTVSNNATGTAFNLLYDEAIPVTVPAASSTSNVVPYVSVESKEADRDTVTLISPAAKHFMQPGEVYSLTPNTVIQKPAYHIKLNSFQTHKFVMGLLYAMVDTAQIQLTEFSIYNSDEYGTSYISTTGLVFALGYRYVFETDVVATDGRYALEYLSGFSSDVERTDIIFPLGGAGHSFVFDHVFTGTLGRILSLTYFPRNGWMWPNGTWRQVIQVVNNTGRDIYIRDTNGVTYCYLGSPSAGVSFIRSMIVNFPFNMVINQGSGLAPFAYDVYFSKNGNYMGGLYGGNTGVPFQLPLAVFAGTNESGHHHADTIFIEAS